VIACQLQHGGTSGRDGSFNLHKLGVITSHGELFKTISERAFLPNGLNFATDQARTLVEARCQKTFDGFNWFMGFDQTIAASTYAVIGSESKA
jgi:hypothetical protein